MMDVYQEVTNRIISQLEQGVIPWQKPWVASGAAISHSTGKPYSLLNQMLLGRPGEYLTFKQCQQEGGKIKKGEKANMVVFWKWLDVEDEETKKIEKIPLLRYYNVFHIDQCEGIKLKYTEGLPCVAKPEEEAEKVIEGYISRSGVKLRHEEGDRAYYSPGKDMITLPIIDQFISAAEYYSTAFHELTHSTGHESRLNRLSKVVCFGSEEYSKEELIAEIGSATLMTRTGFETKGSFNNSVSYIQSWLKALQNDKRMIVSAAGKAEKAVKLIMDDEDKAA